MKKLTLVAIMLLIPFSAFALDAMNDSALDEITAQEGVTITFDNVVIDQAGMDMAWIDDDGVGEGTTGGYIFVSQDSGNLITLDNTSMTIDVATAGAGGFADGAIAEGTTFIAIGLPSVTIGANARTTTITLDNNFDEDTFVPTPADTTESLGSLYQNTTSNTYVSGDIYIYAHSN